MTSPDPRNGPPAAARRLFPLLAVLLFAPGCGLLFGGDPNKVNIRLRREKQQLESRVAALEQRSEGDGRVIEGLRSDRPTVPTLPADRLARLWTTRGLAFGRLTGGLDRDTTAPGDEGVKVYVSPTDGDGQPIKMAGSFTVEAFDLADEGSPLVGRWEFDVESAKKAWRGSFLDYSYVLECPWQPGRVPRNAELTLKVQFLDELTQVPFRAQQIAKVRLPATARPATNARPAANGTKPAGPATAAD